MMSSVFSGSGVILSPQKTYSMLSSFRTVPVSDKLFLKHIFFATNFAAWGSDDSPSFSKLLLCTFVRFALFVKKLEIFEKGESIYFFFKSTSFTATGNIHHGPDGIPSWVLEENADLFAAPISNMLNSSFKEALVPQSWKYANIIPIPKEKTSKRR